MSHWMDELAEGPARMTDDLFFDEDAYDEDGFFDGADFGDSFDEEQALHMLEDVAAFALEADDADEFLGRLWRGARRVARGLGRGIGRAARGVGRVARTVGRGIGQVSRVVGPIASLIPIPQVQAVGRIASLLGRVLFDEGDEFDAMDDLFDFAEDDEESLDLAAPLVAAVTIRSMMPGVSRLPVATRRRLVHAVTQTTRRLGQTQGAAAIRATPALVRRVTVAAARRRATPRVVAQAITRAGVQVAQRPALTRRLVAQNPVRRTRRPQCPTCGHQHNRRIHVQVTRR